MLSPAGSSETPQPTAPRSFSIDVCSMLTVAPSLSAIHLQIARANVRRTMRYSFRLIDPLSPSARCNAPRKHRASFRVARTARSRREDQASGISGPWMAINFAFGYCPCLPHFSHERRIVPPGWLRSLIEPVMQRGYGEVTEIYRVDQNVIRFDDRHEVAVGDRPMPSDVAQYIEAFDLRFCRACHCCPDPMGGCGAPSDSARRCLSWVFSGLVVLSAQLLRRWLFWLPATWRRSLVRGGGAMVVYGLARLINHRGRDARLIDWLDELTAKCPKKVARNMNDPCGARCPQLYCCNCETPGFSRSRTQIPARAHRRFSVVAF